MNKTKKEITSKEMMLMLYTFVAVQVPKEKMEVWNEGLEALKKVIDELDEIKKLFKEYNIEYKLTNVREALFALTQVRNSDYLDKLKVLKIIIDKIVDLKIFYIVKGFEGNAELYNKYFHREPNRHLTEEEFNLLKEALNNETTTILH